VGSRRGAVYVTDHEAKGVEVVTEGSSVMRGAKGGSEEQRLK